MLECVTLMVTIGAMVSYHGTGEVSTAVVVGVVLAATCIVAVRSFLGVLIGLLFGASVVLGAVTLWYQDVPVPQAVFGNRAFDARAVSVDRRLDRTNVVVVDEVYEQKLQLIVRDRISVLPGDIFTVRGEVERAQDFVTDTGKVFEYEAYLRSKGIVGLVRDPILGPVIETTFSIVRIPTQIRYTVADIFSDYVSFPFDGVLAGMIVGYQGGLPSTVQDLFRDTGVLHVLVLSGYNITLLAGFLALLLKRLPFRVRNIVTILAIVLLVLVSGAGVASARAGIMGSIAVLAGLSIRTYQPLRALTISYLLFFFMSPTTLFVDPGFHLSFFATFFMIFVLPKLETLFAFIPKTAHVDIRELFMLALSAPIFMLPYMMYFAGTFPLSSPIANILFALVTPIVMVVGVVLILFSWITPLASMIGITLSGLGTFVLWFLEWCQKLSLWQTPALPWWGVSLVYICVLIILFRRELSVFVLQWYRTLRRQPSSYS